MRTLADLPTPLHALAMRAPDSTALQVEITQRGQMWMKPGARPRSFTAVQRLAVDRVAFSWGARFPLLGPLELRVVDDYDAGRGALTISIFGLPVRRQQGPETIRGEALRYLAELPLVPPALMRNGDLEFREIDQRRIEVATNVLGERLAVTLELDESGNMIRASTTMRELERDGGWRATPWGGEFRDYTQIGPLLLPAEAEAHWGLDTGRYVYWRGRITEAALVDEPFRR